MSTIPKTHSAFVRWLDEHGPKFPPELMAKAHRVRLILDTFEHHDEKHWQNVREQAPNYWTATVTDLTDFAEAYGRWSAGAENVVALKPKER